jgi:hypothetical protein
MIQRRSRRLRAPGTISDADWSARGFSNAICHHCSPKAGSGLTFCAGRA